MRVAIIGTGVAGLAAADGLHRHHEVTLFEAEARIGGHAQTVGVTLSGERYSVDTGFMVYNERNYPRFSARLTELGVATRPTEMSFSVRCERSGLEYNGNNLNSLFSQRRNLLRPRFYGMLRDILRFNRESPELLQGSAPGPTLGEYLSSGRYGEDFVERYLLPMGAAIWSAPEQVMTRFPARSFVEFFRNHGLLSLNDRPQWRTILGGSRSYVEALSRPFAERIRTGCAARQVVRLKDEVQVHAADGVHSFDEVVLACHSDQALKLISEPTAAEREVLGAIHFHPNTALLHTDVTVLPRRQLAWASWNYHVPASPRANMAVTYNLNILQGIRAPQTLCVTLNYADGVDPAKVLHHLSYEHPVYTPESMLARSRRGEINGVDRLWFCGAYWGYGFHEDGWVSGADTAAAMLARALPQAA